MVPGVVRRGIEELDEPDAAFHQPDGQQTLPAEQIGRRIVDSVEAMCGTALALDVKRLGRFSLHAKRELERSDPSIQLAVDDSVSLVNRVQLADASSLRAGEDIAGRIGEVGDGVVQVADKVPW